MRNTLNIGKPGSSIVGETGAGWDRGWVGQRGFEYVPDIKKFKFFTKQPHYCAASWQKNAMRNLK